MGINLINLDDEYWSATFQAGWSNQVAIGIVRRW